ncbi:MAG: GNAT family N-acetyltransferase [Desulfobacteraceae bacterium]|nr:GNAT family N-acetyltransferase [Desulfobacteraceae bacterium]
MGIIIRLMSASDINSVVSLCCEVQNIHISLFPKVFKPLDKVELANWFKNQLNEKDTFIFLANLNNMNIGYLMLKSIERPEHLFCYNNKSMEITQICVTDSAKNTGVGRSLINAAKKITCAQGLDRIELNVYSLNAEVKRSFEALGFSTYSERMATKC